MKTKVIAIAAVTAGGKTTIVNKLKSILPKATSLHFDDYDFEGAVDDYYQWAINGADYNVWNIEPSSDYVVDRNESVEIIVRDIERIIKI